jgi:hypothetical protein
MSRFSFTGRIVQGDPNKMHQKIDDKTKQPRLKHDGTPLMQVYVALAIPKNPAARLVIPGVPTYEEQRAVIDDVARASWPQFFGTRNPAVQYPASLAADCTNPKFANKIIDGDGFDEKGQPFSANEGWAGCWVIKFSNGFAPKVLEWTANGWTETIHTGRGVKCGDYVTISGNCESNKSNDSPGMYMNFDTVGFEKEGEFIASKSAVDPNAVLGSRGAAPVSAPAVSVGAPAPSTPASTIAPAYSGYRETPAAPPPPPVPAVAAGPIMLPAANGIAYETYRAQGWTDDQLRQHSYMA